ncbi:MAG TPA: DNA-directed RNA polymerase subunit alpha, partial [Planctomycetota bacterium]|nr:DNA-directed RNA polymerase subunit alpha [Planctomycetota bacterium]
MVMRARWRSFELPTKIEVEKASLTSTYGKFIAEPFERGFGITVGNSIRRVLLSSLEGAAVTTVKIEGVQHEFSSLPGIVEDVTDIVLNVKQLLVKVRTDEPRKIKIDVKKKGTVTGADIQPDAMVEVVNPDLVIATLSEEVPFKMEMEVRRGRGYVTAEENDSEDREIGVIPIDSIYSPVRRVRYRTENTRVGQLTDYDKLILEIWTNGTVHPENALVEAAKILRKHLIPFVNYFELGDALEAESFEEEESAAAAGA